MAVISVIVPAFNERKALEGVVAGLRAELPDAQIVVVDDGSTDGTGKLCAGMEAVHNVDCVLLEKNAGKTAAFARGLERVRGEEIVLFESDGQYEPRDVKRLVERLKEFEVVNGVRTERAEGARRELISRLFSLFQGLTVGLKVKDVNSGLKAFRKETAEELFAEEMLERFNAHRAYHRFVLAVAHSLGHSIGEVPISHYNRKGGKSYLSPWKTPLRTLATFLKLLEWRLS